MNKSSPELVKKLQQAVADLDDIEKEEERLEVEIVKAGDNPHLLDECRIREEYLEERRQKVEIAARAALAEFRTAQGK